MRMLAGQSNPLWHYAAAAYPGKVGLLMGPSYFKKQRIQRWMPYVLDNDAFTLRDNWSESAWLEMLEWARMSQYKPQWILVPDKVGNCEETIRLWHKYLPIAKSFGWPVAFAVQDGISVSDVPDADVVFVGGTTEWKWKNIEQWNIFKRVHVGRVNSIFRVWQCQDLGYESVDGTGWFRDPSNPEKLPALEEWMQGVRRPQTTELKFY